MLKVQIKKGKFKENSVPETLVFEDCEQCKATNLRYPRTFFSVGCPHCNAGLPGCKVHDSLFGRKAYHLDQPA